MRKILLLFFFCGILSCKNQKITADSPEKFIIENLAEVIGQGKLKKVYPEARVVQGVDVFEEGTVEKKYSILYPDSPEEILILWQDEEREKFDEIHFSGTGQWRSATGISRNSRYEDLVEINKGPIKVYGFGWDYSGAVDWNKGELAGKGIHVFLAPGNAPPQAFFGDHVIEATPGQLERLDLKVEKIVLRRPEEGEEKEDGST